MSELQTKFYCNMQGISSKLKVHPWGFTANNNASYSLTEYYVRIYAGESCLVPSNTRGRSVPFRGDVCPSLPSGTMAIITSYKFECYGRIRAWHTFVRPQSVEEPNLAHTISFQVWRQAPLANTEGCYELVGENVFRDVVADKDGRVSMVACPCSAISVRPGDVVGYYTKVNSSCDITSTEIKLDVSYTMENVWYHTNTKKDPLLNSGNLACPFPVGPEPAKSLRSHLRAAPMLSIEMGKRLGCGTNVYIMCLQIHSACKC